jgi:protein associated with RNAse G/E
MALLEEVTINSRKYDLSIRRSWNARLITRSETHLFFVGTFAESVIHPDLGTIEKGTVSYEYFWLDRWYSVFKFLEPSGELRNWYCNINIPPEFDGSALDYVDLDIDILVWPDNSTQILDRDEFEVNAEQYSYPDEVRRNTVKAEAELLELIRRNEFPFDQ